jgi:hypothetical protein
MSAAFRGCISIGIICWAIGKMWMTVVSVMLFFGSTAIQNQITYKYNFNAFFAQGKIHTEIDEVNKPKQKSTRKFTMKKAIIQTNKNKQMVKKEILITCLG